MDINDKVVLVTGASSGIGKATARAFVQGGGRVALLARRVDRIQSLAEELGGEGTAVAIECDVTDDAQVADAVRTASETFGRINIAVNCAGQGLQAEIEKIVPADFRGLLDLNLVAPLVVMQAVIPEMRAQGAGVIVNVSSGISFGDIPGSGAYAASKTGLGKLSSVARAELGDAGIVVSTMYPFVTRTEFTESVRAGQEEAAALESDHAPDPQSPDQVAEAILELVRSGDAQADLVPVEFGGSYRV